MLGHQQGEKAEKAILGKRTEQNQENNKAVGPGILKNKVVTGCWALDTQFPGPAETKPAFPLTLTP